jgi:hypothetical protein
LRQPAAEFWRATPRQFRALQKRLLYARAEHIADAANAQGASVTPEDVLRKAQQPQCKPGQLGPEVFERFAEVFEDGKT